MNTSNVPRPPARLAPLARLCRDDLPDLVLGSTCVGCERPGRALCPPCAEVLARAPARARPDPEPPGMPETWAMTAYAGTARVALVAHKERSARGLTAPLGDALGDALRAAVEATRERAGPGEIWVVPIPTTRRAVRARGDDPLRRLTLRALRRARASPRAGARSSTPAEAGGRLRAVPALRVVRRLSDQAGLDASERAANLADAFAVQSCLVPRLRGRAVVLVDDVVTTGATLAEAARAVRAAGGRAEAAAVVAATQRWR